MSTQTQTQIPTPTADVLVVPVVPVPVPPTPAQLRLVPFGKTLATLLRNGEHSDIIRFSPDGDAVYIFDRKALSEQVMPVLGMRPNWQSFVRQLRNYGFHYASQRRRADYVDVYVHATFHRDNFINPVCVNVRESFMGDFHKRAEAAQRKAPGVRPSMVTKPDAPRVANAPKTKIPRASITLIPDSECDESRGPRPTPMA